MISNKSKYRKDFFCKFFIVYFDGFYRPLSTNSFSRLIDLSQFRLSHAALIHLHSRDVIYIRKHVIWFGSSPLNDICLSNFNHSHSCPHITERHACLYYDRKRNLFELLNYSEYGTIVNELRYGLGSLTDDDQCNKQENETLEKCFCLNKALYHSDWDGPAQIEQGTVIKIGCHEFLFYRHIVR
jgi:pSer/pThr/pTyr-binding forkhead associated (FHA) protein